MQCPKCKSTKLNTYRHIGARVWCGVCGYVIHKEGSIPSGPDGSILEDFTSLLIAAQDLATYRDGTQSYNEARATVEYMTQKYKEDT